MLTIFNDKGKRLITTRGKNETDLRSICESNEKIFKKKQDDVQGIILFKSLSNTEAKTTSSYFYLWKNYKLEFKVS